MTCAVEEAVILAGGLGTRLQPVVAGVPKPLAPVARRPFLAHLLDKLERAGLRRVVLATGHGSGLIEAAFGQRHGGLAIDYSTETAPLGTGGALWNALARCRGERVFAVNGDTYFDLDYAAMSAAPACDVLVAVRPVAERARYGSVRLEGTRIAAFQEKGARGGGLVSSGVYLLRRDLARRVPRTPPFSFERDILERALDRLSIHAFSWEAAFIDIGTPEDFARAQELLPAWTGGRGP
jgi:D-glycero-alpha-D-manno-heptose 1-phosphate guanylyltransferase